MSAHTYVFAIADRPHGLVRIGISSSLVLDILKHAQPWSSWYLVHFERVTDSRQVLFGLTELPDARAWINVANPSWRDRFGDLLMEWDRTVSSGGECRSRMSQ